MTAREYEMMQSNRFTPPNITEFGGTLVATTPEETIWNQAFEQARARIENPRWLAPGLSYEGQTGNIDAPEMVNEQVFTPIVEAFHPEAAAVIDRNNLRDQYQLGNQDLARRRLDQSIIDDAEMRKLQRESLEFRKKQADSRNTIFVTEKIPATKDSPERTVRRPANADELTAMGLGVPDFRVLEKGFNMADMGMAKPGFEQSPFMPPDVSQLQPALPPASTIPGRLRYKLVNGVLQLTQ